MRGGKDIAITLAFDNVYGEAGVVSTTFEGRVPPPPANRNSEEFLRWVSDHLDVGGVGPDHPKGHAAYFMTVTACDDPTLVGFSYEWYDT